MTTNTKLMNHEAQFAITNASLDSDKIQAALSNEVMSNARAAYSRLTSTLSRLLTAKTKFEVVFKMDGIKSFPQVTDFQNKTCENAWLAVSAIRDTDIAMNNSNNTDITRLAESTKTIVEMLGMIQKYEQ